MQTLAYLLPVLTKAIQNAEKEFLTLQQQGKAHDAGTLQALVVVPSRELAIQIVRVAQGLLPHEARATIQQCIGGANFNRQVSSSHAASSCAVLLCKVVIASHIPSAVLRGFDASFHSQAGCQRDTCVSWKHAADASIHDMTHSSALCTLSLTHQRVFLRQQES